jgi:hypothetical protein
MAKVEEKSMMDRLWQRKPGAAVALLAVGCGLLLGAGPAGAAVRPTVTVTNDANHDGVFSSSETLPQKAKYPWTVDYSVTIDTTGTPAGAIVVSLTDDKTANIGTCQGLVGTTIPTNQSATCTYGVTLTGAGSGPLVNTVSLFYNGGGRDFVTGSSTVLFPAAKAKCNSGNGNGSDPIQFTDPTAHCYGGDPGNSYNAGNKGGDEIPTSGGNPNPGGNNVP